MAFSRITSFIPGVRVGLALAYCGACASTDAPVADSPSAVGATATSGRGAAAMSGTTAGAAVITVAGMPGAGGHAGREQAGSNAAAGAQASAAGTGPSAAASGALAAGAAAAGNAGSLGAAGVSGAAGVAAAAGASAGTAGSGTCDDTCPKPAAGVAIGCKTRFMFGVNYAWIDFGQDFGGAARGVAANRATVLSNLQDMKQNGVNVVRWWMHPAFYAPGVMFDASGTPTGIGGTEAADIEAALDLAEQAGVYLKLTLFSFDNFRGDDRAGHGLTKLITDAARRKALVDNVVRPIARVVSASAHAERMISWDVINEPEWAITGNDGRGDQAFDANPELMSVSFTDMETFVRDVVDALRMENASPITVGQAAIKWSHAFTQVGLDYYDMHYYGWVDQYFPIGSKSLADYGVGDKPVVVGEFPLDGWMNPNGTLDAGQIVDKLFKAGFAGAKAWAFTADGNWAGNKGKLQSFAADKGCAVAY